MISLKLLTALSSIQSQWSTQVFTGTYIDAKDQSAEFTTYKQTTKRTWVADKQDLATLFGNVVRQNYGPTDCVSILHLRDWHCQIWMQHGSCWKRRLNGVEIDCPKSGPGQVRGIFSGPGPGPPRPVQSLARPGPGPHWTGSTRVGPGPGQVRTWT